MVVSNGVPSISVIICAYAEDRWNELIAAVSSIQQQRLAPQEIIVVIDRNPDLLERSRRQFPDLLVIENQNHPGLSGARNTGIAVAKGAVIAFIDDDAVAAPDWLAQLAQRYVDPQVLGVGGSIEPMWTERQPRWFPDEFNWVVGCTYRGMPRTVSPIRNLIGCNMSFRREIFQALGGFRSDIGRVGTRPVGCEETEFSIRVHQKWRSSVLLYDPKARVQHRVSTRRARLDYFFSRCYSEGLSKAIVACYVGAGDALASERTYTFQTLPRGIARGLADTIRRRDPMGLARSAAIIAGLAVTTVGYFYGIVYEWFTARDASIQNLEVLEKDEGNVIFHRSI